MDATHWDKTATLHLMRLNAIRDEIRTRKSKQIADLARHETCFNSAEMPDDPVRQPQGGWWGTITRPCFDDPLAGRKHARLD